MRDYLLTSQLDRALLWAAKDADGNGQQTVRPWRGTAERAKRLCKKGFLKKAGITAMWPHVCYVLTDAGFEELQVATELRIR